MPPNITSVANTQKHHIARDGIKNQKVNGVIIAVLLGILTSISMSASQAVTSGASCKKSGTFNVVASQVLICKISKGKLIWQKANKAEINAYQKSQNEKLEKSRKSILDSLLFFSADDEFQQVSENASILRRDEIESWNTALSGFKLILEENKQGLTKKSEELQRLQTLYAQKTQDLQNAQNSKSSIDSQLRFAENDLISLKMSYDSASQSYFAAKSLSDSLYYQYQRAQNENAAILANRVLCDFGFVAGTSCTWGNYNYNASIISQYNIAISRTNSLAGNYSSTYTAYTNGLSRVNTLRNQSASIGSSITSISNELSVTQRDMSVKQNEITRAKDNVSSLEGKALSLNQFDNSIKEQVSKLVALATNHATNLQTFLQRVDEAKVSLDGKALSQVQKNQWDQLVTDLKEAKSKVTSAYYDLLQSSTSLSLELTKALNATK
jgi:chromosome segregation ATPase